MARALKNTVQVFGARCRAAGFLHGDGYWFGAPRRGFIEDFEARRARNRLAVHLQRPNATGRRHNCAQPRHFATKTTELEALRQRMTRAFCGTGNGMPIRGTDRKAISRDDLCRSNTKPSQAEHIFAHEQDLGSGTEQGPETTTQRDKTGKPMPHETRASSSRMDFLTRSSRQWIDRHHVAVHWNG